MTWRGGLTAIGLSVVLAFAVRASVAPAAAGPPAVLLASTDYFCIVRTEMSRPRASSLLAVGILAGVRRRSRGPVRRDSGTGPS